jgi:protein required for attachment to host cells
MARKDEIWVVVADGAEARFFAATEKGLVKARADLSSRGSHQFARALKSDKPGRVFSAAGGSARHAAEPKHDYHKLQKHRFTERIAAALDDACARGQTAQILLVAPRRSIGELRKLLPARVQKRVRKELQKDLTKHTPAQLWSELSPSIYRMAAGLAEQERNGR